MADIPPFDGLGEKALPFLKAVGFHQSRDWFQENKDLYESQVRGPLGDLVEHVSARMEAEGLPFRGSRKGSLFRINRDVRFSKNKDPYNTHCSAVFTRTGTKKDIGLAYVHMANERSFVASGFYSLSTAELAALRRAIVDAPDKVLPVLEELEADGFMFDQHSDALKRNPRGFEDVDDPRLQTVIRQKHFTLSRDVDNAIVTTPKIAEAVIDIAHKTLPLITFGWAAIDPVREAEALKNAD